MSESGSKRSVRRAAVSPSSGGIAGRILARAMRSWDDSLDLARTRIPRPTDMPQAHARGPNSDRVLIFGAGPAVGWGVGSHDLALPGFLARGLAARTGRGSVVDVVADPDIDIETAPAALRELKLSRYDAVVVILGVGAALKMTSPTAWRQGLANVLDEIARASGSSTQMFVTGIPPIRSISIFDSPLGEVADRRAKQLSAVAASVCAGLQQATFVPLTVNVRVKPESHRYWHRAPEEFSYWADLLGVAMAPLLDGTRTANSESGRAESSAAAERKRQKAVDELGFNTMPPDLRLQHIVSMARTSFETQAAIFTILDHGLQRHLAYVGTDLTEIPRIHSFCNATIAGRDALVVPDLSEDERFRDNPLVVDDPHVRFYAGFPIESPSGERIGALCVLDPERRESIADIDVVLLRDLALMAQRELWRYLPQIED